MNNILEECVARKFSWEGYRKILTMFTNAGYQTKFFSELDQQKRHVVIRHDVDFSIRAALDIARIEASLGIYAHYYVLLRTEFYNLCSPTDWQIVREILELGHEVGLHFDASQYDQDIESLEVAAERECTILEAILEHPVTTISFHRPAEALLGLDRKLASRLHAYQPQFFSEIAYCSDSQGAFRFGHPLDHEAFLEGKAMQLLTHPIWWQEKNRDNKMHILDDLHEARSSLLQKEMADNCKPYASHSQNKPSKKA
tara:strand:- start:657 stop:1424 length:768 start_codon:yes stop_codon:yes gene_type:complete